MRNVCDSPSPTESARERPVAVAIESGLLRDRYLNRSVPSHAASDCKSSALQQLMWDNFSIVKMSRPSKMSPDSSPIPLNRSRPTESCPVPSHQSRPGNWPRAQLAVSVGWWVNYLAGQLPIETKCPDPPDRNCPSGAPDDSRRAQAAARRCRPGSTPHRNRKNAGVRDRVSTPLETN